MSPGKLEALEGTEDSFAEGEDMPKAYSMDLRKGMIKACDQGKTILSGETVRGESVI